MQTAGRKCGFQRPSNVSTLPRTSQKNVHSLTYAFISPQCPRIHLWAPWQYSSRQELLESMYVIKTEAGGVTSVLTFGEGFIISKH